MTGGGTCQLSLKQSFTHTPLRIENRATGGTTNGIVAEHHEFIAQDRAGPQATKCNRHATARVAIAQRLWAIRLTAVEQRPCGRTGQPQLLWLWPVALPY